MSQSFPSDDLTTTPIDTTAVSDGGSANREPGWWPAFVHANGGRATRTPDRFIRKHPDSNVIDLAPPEAVNGNHPAASVCQPCRDTARERLERLRAAIEARLARNAARIHETNAPQEAGMVPAGIDPLEEDHVQEPLDAAMPSAPGLADEPWSDAQLDESGLSPARPAVGPFQAFAFASSLYRITISLQPQPLIDLSEDLDAPVRESLILDTVTDESVQPDGDVGTIVSFDTEGHAAGDAEMAFDGDEDAFPDAGHTELEAMESGPGDPLENEAIVLDTQASAPAALLPLPAPAEPERDEIDLSYLSLIGEAVALAPVSAPARIAMSVPDTPDEDHPPCEVLAPVHTMSIMAVPAEAQAGWDAYELPSIALLAAVPEREGEEVTEDILEERAGRVERVIRDFGVKGDVIHVHPGPVVTLYELEPAPGIKSSRVIALSDDIARSMSAVSARVAVIPGRNAIGIELPNTTRETVYLREMLESEAFASSSLKLPICLGKTIGGEPVIADLARMPHLLVAGTTGSGKSVAINTMILSLLYRFTPEQCRLIMVDPKMLELSVYDGIPHLLTPVVTDPKKAIVALRWAVREMEERYRKMSKLGVRNIDGFNARVSEAREKGEVITRTVETGFDKATGELTYSEEVMELDALPYIVVIVDEMADLMMVAGKEIEGAIQRLAQMARAAGIHVILATQRPSVDVITGTIKANFPTRISFQVTSKIDSRTILGEMGAEQLLGQGDMLYMAGGGRITRVHGPFCSDEEVEKVVAHLKRQAKPVYLDEVTADEDDDLLDEDEAIPMDEDDLGLAGTDTYEQAMAVVLRDKKASTSYIQRRLQIGYNRAASIMERMEKDGIVGPANHAGKREILRTSSRG